MVESACWAVHFRRAFATRHRKIKNKLLRMPTGDDNPRSPARVNRYLTALYHALAVAVEQWVWLHENLAKKVRRYAEGRGRTRILSQVELTHLFESCEESECQ